METHKRMFWFVTIVLTLITSCKSSDDEPDAAYKYYMRIQSQVALDLSDNPGEEDILVGGQVSVISRTVSRMKQVMSEYESQQLSTDVEAALLTKCDSIYKEYATAYVQFTGQTLCFVSIIRSKMVDGVSREGTTLKTYYFRALKDVDPGDSGTPTPPEFSMNMPECLEAVDLGLSVLWANCNFGAQKPEEYGGYFAWGDPTGELWSGEGINKGNGGYTWASDNYGGMNPPTEIGGTSLDIVTAHWGNGWHLPSYDEARELCSQCHWVLHTKDGLNWYEVIGPNGNSINIPLGGIFGDIPSQSKSRFMEGPLHTNSKGFYWTSTICPTPGNSSTRGYSVSYGVPTAWVFICRSSLGDLTGKDMFNDHLRAFHMSIRPVHIKAEVQPD